MAEKKAKKAAVEVKEEKKEEPKFDFEAANKKEESERKVRKLMKLVIGSLFCVGGAWLIMTFWTQFLQIFKEWIGVFVILIGLFVILLGMLD